MEYTMGARSGPVEGSTIPEAPYTPKRAAEVIALIHRTRKPLTIKRVENALIIAARVVAELGEEILPLFEALEVELARLKAQEDALQRALRLAGAE